MTGATQATEHEQRQDQRKGRLCDYCNDRVAVLYCRADTAKLCLFCDKEVHSTNQLFSKHSRSQLCDVCDASPASIFCETEHSVLCTNCDWESHSQSNLRVSSVHNRRPIESFSGCPSVNEMFAIIGFDDLDSKALFLNDETRNYSHFDGVDSDGFSDLFAWETPDFVSLDDLIVSSNAGHNFQAIGNRNAAGGQHKEEMLHQLRQLAKLDPNFKYENANIDEPIVGFHSLVPEPISQPGNTNTGSELDAEPNIFPAYEASTLQWFGDSFDHANQLPSTLFKSCKEESFIVPEKHFDTDGFVKNINEGGEGQSQHPTNTEKSSVFHRVSVHELNSQERDSALSRYKEKKKTRRYDKHVRYESRKVRAESRTRIKGRFAKIDH
ncbi:hypothetical protein CUMW_055120 [Citrus unshiu]|nr:hypothetical protein CUMW_055120 [Citrus unshiu]